MEFAEGDGGGEKKTKKFLFCFTLCCARIYNAVCKIMTIWDFSLHFFSCWGIKLQWKKNKRKQISLFSSRSFLATTTTRRLAGAIFYQQYLHKRVEIDFLKSSLFYGFRVPSILFLLLFILKKRSNLNALLSSLFPYSNSFCNNVVPHSKRSMRFKMATLLFKTLFLLLVMPSIQIKYNFLSKKRNAIDDGEREGFINILSRS